MTLSLLRTRLDIRHLRLIVAIDEAGSVTRAGEMLGLTQPALSRQITEAERRLGVLLYHRENKRLQLTPAGRCLLENAQRILADLRRAESDVKDFPSTPRTTVRLGINAYPWHGWLPRFLAAPLFPGDLEVEVVKFPGHRALDALRQNLIDLALFAGPFDGRGLNALPLFEDALVAVMAPDDRLAGRAVLEAEDFAEVDFVTYGPTYEKGFETERVLRPAKVWPRSLVKVDQTEGVVAMVAAGLGVSILSDWSVRGHVAAGRLASARVTAEGLPILWQGAVRSQDGKAGAARRLLEALAAWCDGDPAAFAG